MIVDNAQAVKFISEPFAFTQHTLYMLLLFVKHKVRCYAMTGVANVVQNDCGPCIVLDAFVDHETTFLVAMLLMTVIES